MSPELSKQLCEKYPKIFLNGNSSYQESLMSFGFECGDGWYKIIDMLCMAATYTYSTSIKINEEDGIRLGIKPYTLKNDPNLHYVFSIEPPQLVATQIKEKFGGLRFYYNLEFNPTLVELSKTEKYPQIKEIIGSYSNYFDGIVQMAVIVSIHTCEFTGKDGELHVSGGNRNGWYKTLNREFAKTDPFHLSRNYVPVKDIPLDETVVMNPEPFINLPKQESDEKE